MKIFFTDFVREYCQKNKISSYRLAKSSGLSTTYCYRLFVRKMNNPSIFTIEKLLLGLAKEQKKLAKKRG